MINVTLIAQTDKKPLELSSHAALVCYQPVAPSLGKMIDVKERLFTTGHHTTLQHSSFTFLIKNIAVGDITFGLHLASPFYNSDQRSGRFCAEMFSKPDYEHIQQYILSHWPEISGSSLTQIMRYVRNCIETYQNNLAEASRLAKSLIKKERPLASDKYIEQNGPKIAQEQLRMVVPIIFPTALDFTVNLSTLAALFRTAWTPPMQNTIKQMVKLLLDEHPEVGFMFNENGQSQNTWTPALPSLESICIKHQPGLRLLDISGLDDFVPLEAKNMHPVDLLHFSPAMMNNSFGRISTEIEISIATMGQDQRHRTVSRGKPDFTGAFYSPPILQAMNLDSQARELMQSWIGLTGIPDTLKMILAPYGAMVKYRKSGSFNAIAHEQGKRLCWCAQEEIYSAGRLLRQAVSERLPNQPEIARMFEPSCYRTGVCAEGVRFCGRNIKLRETGDYFPKRKI